MKLTMFSNFLNEHQLPLCNEFSDMDDVEFTFVSLLKTEGVVGRASLDNEYPYVLKEYEDNRAAAMKHAVFDDVIIFGDMAGKEQYVRARSKTGKLFFRYAERLLKRGDWWRFFPLKIYRTWDMFGRYKRSNMYVLCASAYTARDLSLFGFPINKCLKWGYFPTTSDKQQRHDSTGCIRNLQLMSAQRLVRWKQVDAQIRLAAELIKSGFSFSLSIVGDGPERERLMRMADRLKTADFVHFLGECDRVKVQQLMNDSDVFLITSNRKEGWGAVVNEAMASGCCVVGNKEVGSVPFLVKNGETGIIYNSSDVDLYKKVFAILSEPRIVASIGEQAQRIVRGEWSAAEAAQRLSLLLTDRAIGINRTWESGPLSSCE